MTAHELARKLLEGPDVPVAVFDTILDGAEEIAYFAECIEPVTLWQVNETSEHSVGWGEPLVDKPRHPSLRVRAVEALRLR